MLNCKVENLPIMYLGLPLGGYPKRSYILQSIIEKVQGKLDKWVYTISLEEEECPLQISCPILPLITCLPSKCQKKISRTLERVMKKFFWKETKEVK